ncbi:tetratricopeptide (TPR) repeat protein [Flavobacterium notoginsengisoli]|nr:tetratricopeptide (TPR) repeat protein [Flavobacterium notoginsengisoli]
MKKIFTLLVLVCVSQVFAQDKIQFDKKFVQSEDKWVAFSADSTGSHPYGFIYIDSQAGLTFDYEGTFKIDPTGKFIPKRREIDGQMKYRLQPNNVLVAFIPDSKFSELNIPKVPEWLKSYKTDEGSVDRLYRWGFMYNGWNECEKALEYLEKAQEIDPEYKGLRVELAYSYNCLKQYQKAVDILKIALKKEPLDAYINKELIYAETKNGNLKEAEDICRKVFKEVSDKTYNAENAYNILQAYYIKKDIKNFNNWFSEANSYLMSNQQIKPLAEQMNAELKQ